MHPPVHTPVPRRQPASPDGAPPAWRVVVMAALAAGLLVLSGCTEESEPPQAAAEPTGTAGDAAPAPPRVEEAAPATPRATPEVPVVGEAIPAGAYDEIGVPVYPGARLLEEHTYRVTVQHQEGAVNMLEILLLTADSIDGVSEFYRGALPSRSTQIFALDGTDGRTVSITTELPDQSSTNILLTEHSDRSSTQIKITHMGAGDISLGQP